MNSSDKKSASPFLVVVAFATVYLVWGSTYFFILKALEGFPPFLLGALRFIIAGFIMLAWCYIIGEKLFVVKDIKKSAVSGLLMLFAGTGVVIWVEQYMASAFVAILISTAPLWFVIMDKPKWKENFTNKFTLAGLFIGFVGILMLFKEKVSGAFNGEDQSVQIGSMLLLLAGSLSWTAGSIYSKYKATSGSNKVNVGWQMLVAGIPFVPLSFIRGEPQHVQWQSISSDAWLSLFFLIFFGSIAAFTAYVWLLQVRSAAQVSTYAYVNPVVAVLLGVFFASEKVSLFQILGLVIILSSVLLINLVKYRTGKKAGAAG